LSDPSTNCLYEFLPFIFISPNSSLSSPAFYSTKLRLSDPHFHPTLSTNSNTHMLDCFFPSYTIPLRNSSPVHPNCSFSEAFKSKEEFFVAFCFVLLSYNTMTRNFCKFLINYGKNFNCTCRSCDKSTVGTNLLRQLLHHVLISPVLTK